MALCAATRYESSRRVGLLAYPGLSASFARVCRPGGLHHVGFGKGFRPCATKSPAGCGYWPERTSPLPLPSPGPDAPAQLTVKLYLCGLSLAPFFTVLFWGLKGLLSSSNGDSSANWIVAFGSPANTNSTVSPCFTEK